MTRDSRRAYLLAVLVLALASGAALLAAGMPWASATVDLLDGTQASQQTSWTGDQVAPVIRATGLVGLAGIAGIVATAGRGRVIVGAILVAAGLAGAWGGISGIASIPELTDGAVARSTTAWPWIALACCIVVVGVGMVAATIGRQWPGLGRRHQRIKATTGSSPWDALDHGQDPTD